MRDCCVIDQVLIAPGILGNGGPHLLVLVGGELAVPRDGNDLPQLDGVDGMAALHIVVDDAVPQPIDPHFT